MNDPKVIQPSPTFKIATMKHSVYSQMFEQSDKESWRRLGEFMRPYNLHSFPEAYKQMTDGSLKAAIFSKLYFEHNWKANLLCDVQIADKILIDFLAFAVTKGSPWNAPISHLLRKYHGNGVLDNIKRKYFVDKCTKETSSKKQFSIFYLSGACIMLVLGIIGSFVFFAMEHIINLCMNKCVRKRKSSYTVTRP